MLKHLWSGALGALLLGASALGAAAVAAEGAAPAAPAATPAAQAAAPAPAAPAAPVVVVATPEQAAAVNQSEQEHTWFDEFMDKMQKGGTTMLVLLALSIFGIAVILERLVNLNRSAIVTAGLADKATPLFLEGKYDEVRELCRKDKSILGRIILAIIEHRDCPRADIQSVTNDIGSREIRLQNSKCYPLAIIAVLAPMLGLLGTVFGMIGAFDTVAQAGEMGNAAILADDIAKALITTAGGLVVAIPMLGCFHFFRARTNKLAMLLEAEAGEIYSAWFLRNGTGKQA